MESFKIDVTGLRCPMVVMTVQRKWKANERPREFIVVSDDSDAPTDLKAFATRNGLHVTQQGTTFIFKPLG